MFSAKMGKEGKQTNEVMTVLMGGILSQCISI